MKLAATLLLATLFAAVSAHADPAQPAGTAEFDAAVMRRSPVEVIETLKRAASERGAGMGDFVQPSKEELMMFEALNGQAPVHW